MQHQNDVSSSTECGICFRAGMAYDTRRDSGTKAIGMGYGRYLAPAIDKIAGIVEIG